MRTTLQKHPKGVRHTLTRITAMICTAGLLAMPFHTALAADYGQLRAGNQGKLAEQHRFLPTIEQAVILTFGGLSRKVPLQNLLERMKEGGMRGTFFVTERELQRNADNLDLIRSYGQDLAIGLTPGETGTYEDYCAQIERIRSALSERYGIQTNFLRIMGAGGNMEAMQEAASAMGCTLVGQGLNVVQSKHKEAQSPAEVMPDIFGKWTTSLNRGEIVYMRTDFYASDTLAADMLTEIKEKKIDNITYLDPDLKGDATKNDSAYHTASLQDVEDRKEFHYKFPVDTKNLPPEMQPEYGTDWVSEENFRKAFYEHYIGAPEVYGMDRMNEFSRTETAHADKTGIIKNVRDNTIFLTFDDWGQDDSINQLLYVLRKHKVHATFFIITRNMLNNPNLLRAIAADGNEIGSHTNNHSAMVRRDENGHTLPVETPEEYDEDVRSSYPKMLSVLGDMRLENGRPALTRLLRPPTLAVSRSGVKEILNAGFTYIVSGSGSTEDYGAVSMQSLVGIMNAIVHEKDGSVRRGSIIIMHMSSTSKLTPRALDILLTANDKLPDGHPGKFKVGLLGDYLKDGYSQTMKQVPAIR